MPRPWAKTIIGLTLALSFFNLYCFAHCLVQSCDASAMPCHSQGHSKSDQCSDRHDVKIAAVNALEGCDATIATELIETFATSPEYAAHTSGPRAALPAGATAFRPLRV